MSNADERFQQVEREYFRLKGQLAAGQITHEQFEAALRPLMFQDAQGRYWMIGVDSGKWHLYDGQQWQQTNPPTASAVTASRPAPPPPTVASTPSKARIVVMRGSTNVPLLELEHDAVTIGRALSNSLVLSDAQASRLHARVDIENGAWVIKDLNSRNGTSLNGNRITQQALRAGDQILIGETLLAFQM